MNLLHVDRHTDISSPVHRLDAIVKLPSFVAFVVVVAILPAGSFIALAVALATLLCVAVVSRVPVRFLLYRTLVVVPFVLMIGAFNLFGRGLDSLLGRVVTSDVLFGPLGVGGLLSAVTSTPDGAAGGVLSSTRDSRAVVLFFTMAAKSLLSVLSFTLLLSTTGSAKLLNATRRFGLPPVLATATGFMLRYVFVLFDELVRLRRSWESRRVGRLAWFVELRYLGSLIGVLLVRSYERAERVYLAMCARGFDGHVTLSPRSPIPLKSFAFPVFLLGPLVVAAFL
jgi:cobalt/nickel transport system permease protein